MRPLVEKSAAANPENSTGIKRGFQRLGEVLKYKNNRIADLQDGAGSHLNGCEITVEAVEEQGLVKKLMVQCSCGEMIEIDCRYGE